MRHTIDGTTTHTNQQCVTKYRYMKLLFTRVQESRSNPCVALVSLGQPILFQGSTAVTDPLSPDAHVQHIKDRDNAWYDTTAAAVLLYWYTDSAGSLYFAATTILVPEAGIWDKIEKIEKLSLKRLSCKVETV